jgi:hypothetical protein
MLPQAPQFVWSLRRSTHAPLGHNVALHVAEQARFEQYGAVAGQTLLQAPQWLRSEAGFMQLVPHRRSPGAHWHCPAEHAIPGAQRLPQTPQLFGSNARLVQTPAHI